MIKIESKMHFNQNEFIKMIKKYTSIKEMSNMQDADTK